MKNIKIALFTIIYLLTTVNTFGIWGLDFLSKKSFSNIENFFKINKELNADIQRSIHSIFYMRAHEQKIPFLRGNFRLSPHFLDTRYDIPVVKVELEKDFEYLRKQWDNNEGLFSLNDESYQNKLNDFDMADEFDYKDPKNVKKIKLKQIYEVKMFYPKMAVMESYSEEAPKFLECFENSEDKENCINYLKSTMKHDEFTDQIRGEYRFLQTLAESFGVNREFYKNNRKINHNKKINYHGNFLKVLDDRWSNRKPIYVNEKRSYLKKIGNRYVNLSEYLDQDTLNEMRNKFIETVYKEYGREYKIDEKVMLNLFKQATDYLKVTFIVTTHE